MLANKTVLVTGIADPESIAYSAAVRAAASGARIVLAAFPRDLGHLDGALHAVGFAARRLWKRPTSTWLGTSDRAGCGPT